MHANTKIAVEWILEIARDAVQDDPDVGINANIDLAYELKRAAHFIESYSEKDFKALLAALSARDQRIAELELLLKIADDGIAEDEDGYMEIIEQKCGRIATLEATLATTQAALKERRSCWDE